MKSCSISHQLAWLLRQRDRERALLPGDGVKHTFICPEAGLQKPFRLLAFHVTVEAVPLHCREGHP